MDTRTSIDRFAGAGGATAGLFLAGCDIRLAVERDKDAAATYSANFPGVQLLSEAIETYTPSYILEKAGLQPGSLDILSACPPCQGFSTLGKCDPDDDRNDYVQTVEALVENLRPRALILENVPGLDHDPRSSRLKASLHSIGYGVGSWVLDATEFCVPQRRRRFVLIAVSGLTNDEIADPRSSYRCADWPDHPHTVRDILHALGPPTAGESLHAARNLPPPILRRVRAVPHDGGSRKDLPESLQLECHKRLSQRGAASVYGRMAWDEPAPTITTRCTTPACGRFLHPEQDRPITLREAAAFQTFPPTFCWKGGVMHIARQIGNAVPVRLAHLLTLHTIRLIRLAEGRSVSSQQLGPDPSPPRSPKTATPAIPSV
ncbi:MAG: DNA cytosine methyltransferase [Dehalococcoidia bacterium]|nr:DNA cytosine methyltransferase [Dehalococcoidia bacterium]